MRRHLYLIYTTCDFIAKGIRSLNEKIRTIYSWDERHSIFVYIFVGKLIKIICEVVRVFALQTMLNDSESLFSNSCVN